MYIWETELTDRLPVELFYQLPQIAVKIRDLEQLVPTIRPIR